MTIQRWKDMNENPIGNFIPGLDRRTSAAAFQQGQIRHGLKKPCKTKLVYNKKE